MELADPTGYGRVIRDGEGAVERVAETKVAGDATAEELAIREVNAGLYVFDGAALLAALDSLGTDNAQSEIYLPDVIPVLRTAGKAVHAHPLGDPDLALGVNDRVDLADVTKLAQTRIHAGPPARRRHDRRPREHADRRDRQHRPGHHDRAVDVPARPHPHRRPLLASAPRAR